MNIAKKHKISRDEYNIKIKQNKSSKNKPTAHHKMLSDMIKKPNTLSLVFCNVSLNQLSIVSCANFKTLCPQANKETVPSYPQ